MVYAALWCGIGLSLVVALFMRPQIEMTVAPIRNPTFVTLADGTIRNAYDVRLRNKLGVTQDFVVSTATKGLTLTVEGSDSGTITVPADSQAQARVYVEAPAGSDIATAARSDLRLWVTDPASGERAAVETNFTGKETE